MAHDLTSCTYGYTVSAILSIPSVQCSAVQISLHYAVSGAGLAVRNAPGITSARCTCCTIKGYAVNPKVHPGSPCTSVDIFRELLARNSH